MGAIETVFADIVGQTLNAITAKIVIGLDAQENLQVVWPVLPDLIQHVAARVDLSALGGLPAGGDGLTAAQIFRLFTAPERDAIFGLIQVEPLILQALMTMALTDARIPLDAPDFLAFVQGLGPPPLGYGVLTPERMQAVLAGEPPA